MSNIEEDIMSEEAFNELIDNFEIVNTLTEYGRKAIKQNVKNLQKIIKELEEENHKILENGLDVLRDTIPVQKVKDKIEEINKEYEDSKDKNGNSEYYYPDYTIRKFKELLEEK